MTVRFARALVSLYPGKWQERYAEEFVGFLQEYPATPRTLLDVIRSAVYEYFRESSRQPFNDSRRSIVLMAYALLLAFAAATNLYWTVDDSPFAVLMQSNFTLALCWSMIAGGGLFAFLAATVCGVPIFLRIVASGQSAARRKLASDLLVIVAPHLVTFCWFLGVILWTGGHWVPLPWALYGNGAGWPNIETRWICGFISLLLLIVTLAVTAVGVRRILGIVDFTGQTVTLWRWWPRASGFAIAISIVLMACGCCGWGLLLQGVQSFHDQPGLLNSSAFDSWLISCGLFAGSGVAGVLGARQIVSSHRT